MTDRPGGTNAVHLTDEELVLVRHAMQSWLKDFGHEEADVVEAIKQVLAKLRAAEPDGEEPRFIA